jgi:hypothetical protein
MKQIKRATGLSLKPQRVSEELWYYEEKDGLHVVFVSEGLTHQVELPWGKITKSIERYQQSKRKR